MKKPLKNSKSPSFWVTNISNRDVRLADLNLNIRAMSVVDLLSNHYDLIEDVLNKSLQSGSLYHKRDMIVKRLIAPILGKDNQLQMDNNTIIPGRQRSVLEIKVEEYPELNLSSDEELAKEQEFNAVAETSDSVEYDRQPLLAKK